MGLKIRLARAGAKKRPYYHIVVADSHAPRRWKGVPHILALELVDADLVLHAGDVCVPEVLDELAIGVVAKFQRW